MAKRDPEVVLRKRMAALVLKGKPTPEELATVFMQYAMLQAMNGYLLPKAVAEILRSCADLVKAGKDEEGASAAAFATELKDWLNAA